MKLKGKFILLILVLICSLFGFVGTTFSKDPVNIYFFYGDGCPHCAKEEPFLKNLEEKYPEVKLHSFEVWYNTQNQKLFAQIGKKLNANSAGVPFTVVGDKYFVGWLSEETTGAAIEQVVLSALEDGCNDIVGDVLNPVPVPDEDKNCPDDSKSPIPKELNFPIIGKIKTKNFSLPVLTVLFGILDGFNPCAMWTLIFLISLLIGMQDKKRMWILGTAFIVASASVYFVFMTAWLNLLLFIGFISIVRVGIGAAAFGGGIFNLREYYTNPTGTCKVTNSQKRKKTLDGLKKFTQEKKFLLALVGIIVLAFAVNLIELICSAGFPAVYTQILTLSNLSRLQYYLYILVYIFFFMLDDLIVFFVALKTLQLVGATSKYSGFSHLVGGILMLIIGLLLIFKPELLVFG